MKQKKIDIGRRIKRTSSKVEAIAEEALKKYFSDNTVYTQRVKKYRVLTKYGYRNLGEDIFHLFDIVAVCAGEVYFVQITDNLKRTMKPYIQFSDDIVGNNKIFSVLMTRIYDDGKEVRFRLRKWSRLQGERKSVCHETMLSHWLMKAGEKP